MYHRGCDHTRRLQNTLRFPCFLGISRPLRVHLSQSHSLHNVDGRERLFLWLNNPLEGKRSLPCSHSTSQPLKRLISLFLDGRNSYRINLSRGVPISGRTEEHPRASDFLVNTKLEDVLSECSITVPPVRPLLPSSESEDPADRLGGYYWTNRSFKPCSPRGTKFL